MKVHDIEWVEHLVVGERISCEACSKAGKDGFIKSVTGVRYGFLAICTCGAFIHVSCAGRVG